LKRAIISITNNSKGSCTEVRNMLVLSRELKFCNQESIQISFDVSIEISQNLSNFIKYLNNNTKD
jgi:four helix bundle protein